MGRKWSEEEDRLVLLSILFLYGDRIDRIDSNKITEIINSNATSTSTDTGASNSRLSHASAQGQGPSTLRTERAVRQRVWDLRKEAEAKLQRADSKSSSTSIGRASNSSSKKFTKGMLANTTKQEGDDDEEEEKFKDSKVGLLSAVKEEPNEQNESFPNLSDSEPVQIRVKIEIDDSD